MDGQRNGWAEFTSIRFEGARSREHALELVQQHMQECGLPEILIEFDDDRLLLRLPEDVN